MNVLNSFILTFLAGFATMVGYLVIYLPYKYKDNIINASLSFAVGVITPSGILCIIIEKSDTNPILYRKLLLGTTLSIIIEKHTPTTIKINIKISLKQKSL